MHDAWPCAHALEINSHIGIDREVNLRRHACPVQDRCQIAVRDAEAVEQEFPVFNLASRQARRGAYLSPPPKRSPIRTFTASFPRRLTGRSGVRAPVRRCVFDGRIDGGRRSAPARPRGVSDDPYVVDPCARPYSPTSPRSKSAAARIAPPKNSRPRSSAISTLSTQSPSPSSGPGLRLDQVRRRQSRQRQAVLRRYPQRRSNSEHNRHNFRIRTLGGVAAPD
jgi:hypothetical protein